MLNIKTNNSTEPEEKESISRKKIKLDMINIHLEKAA
jgi:hypothetical protein